MCELFIFLSDYIYDRILHARKRSAGVLVRETKNLLVVFSGKYMLCSMSYMFSLTLKQQISLKIGLTNTAYTRKQNWK